MWESPTSSHSDSDVLHDQIYSDPISAIDLLVFVLLFIIVHQQKKSGSTANMIDHQHQNVGLFLTL